eukprot:730512-Pyramimonas_sp.AAC.1
MPAGDKAPKSVIAARGELHKAGIDINSTSAADIRKLSDTAINSLYNAMRHTLRSKDPTSFAEYGKCKSDEERHEWLARFVIDPRSGGCKAYSTTTVQKGRSDESTTSWCTISQLAGPEWFNDLQHAKLVAESGELKSRPS